MVRTVVIPLTCLAFASPVGAAKERLELRHVSLDLPGPPARVLSADIDRDGRQDLLVVVAFTEIEQISEDRIENLIQFTRVIPTLFDRREVQAYLATEGGGYVAAGAPLTLPTSVLHMEIGPAPLGPIALTDEGVSRVWLKRPAGEPPRLALEPLIEEKPVLAGTKRFYGDLDLVHDLDGDGVADVLVPTADGLAPYLTRGAKLTAGATRRVEPPDDPGGSSDLAFVRSYPLPEVVEVNGDGNPDLVFTGGVGENRTLDVYLGTGGGGFRPLRDEPLDCHDRGSDLRVAVDTPRDYPWLRNVVALRDLDGDGFAEAVTRVQQERGDSWRKEMKDAKKPLQDYAFHALREDLTLEPDPYFEMRVVGHTMEGDFLEDDESRHGSPFRLEQFIDLDDDGREDLVTITLRFSVFQVVKILATKRIGVGVGFHVYAQQGDGSFREVPDLDLSEKLRLNLNNLKIGRFAQFAGDFDGDGRQDFVHLGRGTTITVHRGQPGCRYPREPDLILELDEEPASLDLVRIEDLDGDGRSDIRITRPLPLDDPDVTAPARLDLYLSGARP